jgi:conjugative relaxase-like TrwC/TraI family protein
MSISKLGVGHARYYVDQAGDRVDAVESIGDGVEEYYAGPSTEARGQWFGAGARELGLHGEVSGEQLRHVLDGSDADGRSLRDASGRITVAGYDLTLSAPKSVSVLFGLAEPEVRDAVRRAHDVAVRAAIGHVDRTAAAVRRGHGGLIVEPASGLVVGLFRHRTSRVGDPQLHTHAVVANLGRGPDGRWSALDGRRLYAQARTASFIYHAVLRCELTRELGVEWTVMRRGIAEVAGIPRPVLRAFSRRRAEIEAELERHGTSGPAASEAAAFATRRRKDRSIGPDQLAGEWRERAADLGFDQGRLMSVLGRARRREVSAEWERLFDVLASSVGLTRGQSSFDRRDVVQALCEWLPAGAVIDAQQLEAAADRFLGCPRAVALLPDGESFRRADGRLMPLARDQLRYSTPELLAREQQIIERATTPVAAPVPRAGDDAIAAAVARRPTLSGEQQQMVERVCDSRARVVIVAGKAGTGKTFALAAAREAWQQDGHPVLGVAVARRAARELTAGAGIQATSTAALLHDLRNALPLPKSCVLVVDEAGMVATRQLSELLEHVERAGGKLVLVGDHRQLPEIEAGGAFRALVARGLAVELVHNQRQAEAWERRALDHVADGHVADGHAADAVAAYHRHGRIHLGATADDTRALLVKDWWQLTQAGEDAIILAHRRADVAELNQLARDAMRAGGRLRGPELLLPGGAFAAGDFVVIKRNDTQHDVTNGDRGTVTHVDPEHQRLTVRIDDRETELGPGFLHDTSSQGGPTLLHGYALTCHVAQGLTTDSALLLADHGLSRELAYTALSRGRTANHLYLTEQAEPPHAEYAPVEPARDPLAVLATMLATSGAQRLATELDPTAGQRQAEERLRRAQQDRLAIETSRWTPKRGHRLAAAQRRETAAVHDLARARRVGAERRHGAQPFVTSHDLEERHAKQAERLAERLEATRARDSGHQ